MAQGITGSFDLFDKNQWTKVTVNYSETYDVGANQSVVEITGILVTAISPNGYYGLTYYPNGTVSIDGQAAITMNSGAGTHNCYVGSQDAPYSIKTSGGSIATGSVSVPHDSTGEKTVRITVSLSGYSSLYNWTVSGYVDVALTSIPRVSQPTLSASSVYLGEPVTIYSNRKNAGFTHTVSYSFSGFSEEIGSGVEDAVQFTFPYHLAGRIPSNRSGTASVVCKTYYGSTLVGSAEVSITLNVPDNDITKPKLNVSLSPVSALPSQFSGYYIQGKTALRIQPGASSEYSKISVCRATVGNKSYDGTDIQTEIVSEAGTVNVLITAIDARGYSRSVTVPVAVIPYAPPSLSDAFVRRTDSAGTEMPGGDYLHLRFTKSFSSVAGKNTCTVKFRVKQDGESWGGWVSVAESSYDSVLSGYFPEPDRAYTAELSVSDDVGGSAVYTYKLASLFRTMHLSAGGRGIAFGKKSTWDGFECGMNARFYGNTFFHGNTVFDGNLQHADGDTKIKLVRYITWEEIDQTASNPTYFKEWLKTVCRENPGFSYVTVMGLARPNALHFVICTIYDTSMLNSEGLPQYSGGIAINGVGGTIFCFGTSSYTYTCE